MDAIISHAYGFSCIMAVILITYTVIYLLKKSEEKYAENGKKIIRYAFWGLNIILHFALIVFILYIDAGMEALLISLLASASVALVVGGGI